MKHRSTFRAACNLALAFMAAAAAGLLLLKQLYPVAAVMALSAVLCVMKSRQHLTRAGQQGVGRGQSSRWPPHFSASLACCT
jgi:hypothetical protein